MAKRNKELISLTHVTTKQRSNKRDLSMLYQTGTRNTRYFDIVPVDALSVLVKHFSKLPHCEKWLRRVNANDAQTVLRVGGSLSTASREMFKSLNWGDFFGFRNLHECKLLATLMAPHLECLDIFDNYLRGVEYERFRSLRILHLDHFEDMNELERLLSGCGDALIELDVTRSYMKQRMVRVIACHCKSLKVLSIDYRKSQASLEPIWKAIGSILIELSGEVPESELNHIANNCTHVEKLKLRNLHRLRLASSDKVTKLLGALKRLRILDLRLDGCDRFNIPTLLDVCPSDNHIYLYVMYVHIDGIADYIRDFGTNLRRMEMESNYGTMPKDVIPKLANIEKLTLWPFGDESVDRVCTAVESIYIKPMPNLRELSISCVSSSKILAVLARSVSNLHEFHCKIEPESEEKQGHVRLKDSDFINLFQANQHVHHISLDYGEFSDKWTVTDGIVAFIPVCKNLKHVVITYCEDHGRGVQIGVWDEDIGEACVPLRTKSLSLVFNYVCYLPVSVL